MPIVLQIGSTISASSRCGHCSTRDIATPKREMDSCTVITVPTLIYFEPVIGDSQQLILELRCRSSATSETSRDVKEVNSVSEARSRRRQFPFIDQL
jgi:hypothetical protein